ncbi:MAG: hypothetical protein QW508_06535 [Conexivisphaerales archaeon]
MEAEHVHTRKKLQKKGKYRKIKEIKNGERNIERNLNHKVSKKKRNRMGIKLEYLQGIRNAKSSRNFRYSLNSWSFYNR